VPLKEYEQFELQQAHRSQLRLVEKSFSDKKKMLSSICFVLECRTGLWKWLKAIVYHSKLLE